MNQLGAGEGPMGTMGQVCFMPASHLHAVTIIWYCLLERFPLYHHVRCQFSRLSAGRQKGPAAFQGRGHSLAAGGAPQAAEGTGVFAADQQ
jgi:hypothetical protein